MNWLDLNVLMAMVPQLGQSGQSNSAPYFLNLLPLPLVIVVFYFALIRPQQQKTKQQAELLKSLKPGDKVVTNSGIMGVVVAVKDKSVSLRSADAKLEILKSAVTEITERTGAATNA